MWAANPDGKIFRYREIYHTGRTVAEHCKHIREVCKLNKEPIPTIVVCDHDAEDRATFSNEMGMHTVPAFKQVSPGVQAVQQRLKIGLDSKPRLFFLRDSLVERDETLFAKKLPVCTEEEIVSYVWPKNDSGASVKEAPVKEHDHGMDAMRYIVCNIDRISYDAARVVTVDFPNDPRAYEISPI